MLRKFITGLSVAYQYNCCSLEKLREPLRVSCTMKGTDHVADVTSSHLLLGYKPLLIGLKSWGAMPLKCSLQFHQGVVNIDSRWRGYPADHDSIATLEMEKAEEFSAETGVVLYRGVYGEHAFLKTYHQIINNFRDSLRKQRPGNVGLDGNLHDQVRIAYSVPRIIGLITLTEGEMMNAFPTDLHGEASGKFYISSLRAGGTATHQVERIKKLALSTVRSDSRRETYALGKNHMQDLRPVEQFNCHETRSAKFNIPLPDAVLAYYELELTRTHVAGIHRLHVYKIANHETISAGDTLAHIHQYYAQWRIDHNIETRLLPR